MAGALSVLPLGLRGYICAQIYAGELATAAAAIDDQRIASEATGSRLAPYGELILTAWRGDEAELSALVEATLEEIVPRGEGIGVSTCQWVTALLHNGLGNYARALAAAELVLDPPRKLDWTINATLPELVEAAARSGQQQRARDALDQLSAITRPSGSDWGLGLEARSRALLSGPDTAEPHYREAVERLGRTRVRGDRAREQLRSAYRLFSEMGMEAFAERARGELRATGETVRKRQAVARDELTPQEKEIARLAREGLSNLEIGARLFLSPRTVEWHLRKVFAKLGFRSRQELSRV